MSKENINPWPMKWDFTRVAENDSKGMMEALNGGFEPFAAVPLPVQVRSQLEVQNQIAMAVFIYLKRPSTTNEDIVEEVDENIPRLSLT